MNVQALKALREQAWIPTPLGDKFSLHFDDTKYLELVTKYIVQQCIDEIETYRIPVGNSPAGELACEWTYDALKTIRDSILEKFEL